MRALRTEPARDPVGTVVLVHGFTRSPDAMGVLSGRCVGLGARTLRPALGSLWWPSSTNNAQHLDRLATTLLPDVVGPLVVAGHSAGAAAGAWLAAGLRDRGADLRALVMVDGVESPTKLISRAWPRLGGVAVDAICAPPSRCNRHGALADWLAAQSGDLRVSCILGSGHGDIEGRPHAVYRWACGDDPGQPAADDVLDATEGAIARGLGVR